MTDGGYDFDLLTIGAGSGGVRASRLAASLGARVAIVEERYLGGTCVNVGCIPKKLLVYASEFAGAFEDSSGFGWNVGARDVDWQRLIANKDREIERLNGVYRRLLEASGAEILDGHAKLVDPHAVEIDGRRYRAERILIATGSWPRVAPIPGAELAITSNEAFHLEDRPRRAIVAGGGYIAVEFAGIFHGLGAEVTLVHRGAVFLRGFDDDVRGILADEMQKQGIDLRFTHTIERIERAGSGVRATLNDGRTLDADLVLGAIGRVPNTREIGLEEVGVKLDGEGAVQVDEYSCSSVPHIWAIGDCTNRKNLTPVAIAEAHAFVDTVFQNRPTAMDYMNVPSAVFSHPAIGCVGLTEAQARERCGEVDVYRSTFRALKHTVSGREEKSFMKLVVDPTTDRVLGCHMVGAEAGEIVQGFAVALKCGATKRQFDSTVGIHPTAAEEFVTMRQKS